MTKEFKKTSKYFKKNRKVITQTIIPVVIFCLFVTIIGILITKPNDNISPSKRGYLFENRNPRFNVAFGSKENTEKSLVRFEAKLSDNPFEQNDNNLWKSVTRLFSRKKGFEFGLSQINFSETDSEIGKKLVEQIGSAIEEMEIDDVSTGTEVIEVGRLLGEVDENSQSKKTVINKDVYPGIDVEYQILEGLGVKEEIVIRDIEEYTSNCGEDNECLLPLNEFVFDLKLDEGLELKQSMAMTRGKIENTYYITDSNGNYFAHFLPTFAIDEAGSRTSGVDFDISNVEGNSYRMIVTLDPDWLFSNQRVFPIRIDPSIVHDTTTEFDTGTDYNTEVATGPKVQLEDPEVYYTDSNVVGYWKMDDNVTSIIPDDPDLEGYWDFEEASGTLYDKSANSNNGTASGTTSTDGKIGNGRSFNGGSDYISVPTNATLNITGNLTVETWIKPDDTLGTANANRWLEKGDCYYLLEGDGGVLGTGITFAIKSSNAITYVDTGVTEAAGQWYHVVGVHDDSANLLRLYINGTQVNTTAFSGTIDNDNLALRIGSDDSGIYFDGLVDEVGIYSTALSATEIEARYELGRDILDSSGNDNHGLTLGTDYVEDGVLDGARYFDGTDDYIYTSGSNLPTGDFTYDLWLKPKSFDANQAPIMISDTSGGNELLTYVNTSGQVMIYTNGASRVTSSNSLTLGAWNHLAFSRSGSTIKVYINGIEDGITGSDSGTLNFTGCGMLIGADSDQGCNGVVNDWFDGLIDEVRVSNIARPADDIQRLYQIGYEKMIQGAHTSAELDIGSTADIESITWTPVGDNTGDGETPYSTTGLVGQWNFNETSGTTVDNQGSCGSSCDGTLTSFSDTSGQDVEENSGWTSDNRRWGDGALMFDNTDDYVDFGSNSALNITGSLTLEAWVKASGTGAIVTWANSSSSGYPFHILILSSGQIRFNASNVDPVDSDGSVTWNEWNHVAVVASGTDILFYINGQLDSTKDFGTSTRGTGDGYMTVSRAGSQIFNGTIDTLRLYSRSLTANEIFSNYQSGNIEMRYRTSTDGNTWSSWKGGTESSVENFDDEEYLYDPDSSGLLAYYPMDETSGSTATDVAGTNNGSVTGTSIIDGRYKKGRDFTSTNDVMAITSIDLSSINYTIETWFKFPLDSNGGNWNTLTRGVNNDHQVIVQTSTKEIGVYDNASGGGWYSSGYDLDNLDNGWHHLVAVGAGKTDFYIDGQYVGDSGFRSYAEISYVGNYQGGGQNWGVMDEFKIYNKALTPSDIYSNWLEGSSNYANIEEDEITNSVDGNGAMEIRANGASVDGNTVGYWRMDDNIESIVPEDANLEGYWDLVESSGSGAYLLDKSDNTNNGTPNGSTYSDGKINGGRTFNGSSDYVNIPNNSSLTFERTDSFSLEMWFKADGSITSTQSIFSKMNVTDEEGYEIFIYNNDIWFMLSSTWDTNCIAVYADGVTVTDGAWHHVIATYDGTSSAGGVTMYIDGTSRSLTSYRNNLSSTTIESNPVTIGARTGGLYFDGDVDEAGIYSKELSPTEALVRYRAGLDIKDSSGNGYHGSSNYLPYVKGKIDGARSFDGSNDQVRINSNMGLGTSNVTLEAWVYLDSTSESGLIVNVGGSSNGYGMGIGDSSWDNDGNDLILLFDMVRWIDTGVTVGTGWNHISMVLNSSSKPSAYINGELVYSDTSTNPSSPSSYTYFGGYGERYLDAIIDDVRISNTARTVDEIEDSYNMGKGEYIGKNISSNDISNNTLLPFWIASDALGYNMDFMYRESPDDINGASGSSGEVIVAYTTVGSDTFTVPSDVYTLDAVLIVAGGGGGGARHGGGGGAGGLRYFTDYSVTPEEDISITVGGGGARKIGNVSPSTGGDGGNSVFDGISAEGGGGGGGGYAPRGGRDGGSGGGDAGDSDPGSGNVPSVSPSQGNDGGDGVYGGWYGGGGGGHSSVGADGTASSGGNGGSGTYYGNVFGDTYGESGYFAGGGGGGRWTSGSVGSGGVGGGGDGGQDATANTGGGGGGGIEENYSGYGGSGIVLIKYTLNSDSRTHPINISFKADLESSNLISDVSDTSFTISEQDYGTSDHIENIDVGQKIIIKENYNGTQYIAQGDLATVNTSTGAVTVSSWDASSTFPTFGFTTAATVFKWQREYVDIRYPLDEDIDGITNLIFRKTTDVPAIFWIDDLKKATYSSDYDASEFGALGATTAVETAIDSFDQDYLYDTSTSNLTAYYPMDEGSGTTVDNVISTSYDGTASGTNIIDGKFSKARRFNGSSDYVNLGSTFQPSLPITVSAWIFADNIGTIGGIFNTDKLYFSAHNHSGIFLNLNTTGTISISYGDNVGGCNSTGRRTAETTSTILSGKWYHVVGIIRGATDMDIYFNGVEEPVTYSGTGGSLTYAGRNAGIGAIGSCADGSVESFDGTIDEVQVYTRSLSSSEVWDLYNSGSTSPRSIRTTNIGSHVEGTGAWQFDSDTYTVDPATVGLWHLDESSGSGAYLLDSSYNSYHGTPTGTTFVSSGKFNGARSFDGTGSDYITTSLDTEADSLYASSGHTWSVEAWFKYNGGLTEDGVIVGRGAGTGTSGHFGIFVDSSNNLRTVLRGAYTTLRSGVSDNTWHHVAVTWDGSIGRAYFDGDFQTELSIGTAGVQSYNVSIGAQRDGGNFFYEGEIDEVRIANISLPSSEILSAYNKGKNSYITKSFPSSNLSGHVVLPFWIASDSLGNNFDAIYGEESYALYNTDTYTEGLWHLDESSGSGAYLLDSSPNGNNATPSGATYVEGRHSGGRYFDGVNDYLNAGSSSTLAPTTELTVSAWVYPYSGPSGEGRTAVSKWRYVNASESYGWNFGAIWQNSTFQFIVSDGGATADHVVEDPTFFTKHIGQWVHMVGVFKSGEYLRLYENGQLIAENTTSVPNSISYITNDLTIGRRSSESQSEWHGRIDEVRVSSIARTTAQIEQEYNYGKYKHNITVAFKADLQSGNLISGVADKSFSITEQPYGKTAHIENIGLGEKIVVKEVSGGTQYVAQGDIDTVDTSTGAVTVSSWEAGSTFPTSGFTTSAVVFKWQREEIDISNFLTGGEVELRDITFRKVTDVEGILWIDDLKKATAAVNPDTSYLEGVQYVQYEVIFTKWDDNPLLDLYLAEVDITYSSGPTMDQIMRHGKWFNSSGEKQPFWWANTE